MNKLMMIFLMLITFSFIGCGINPTSSTVTEEEKAIIADTTYYNQWLFHDGRHSEHYSRYYSKYLNNTSMYSSDTSTYLQKYTYNAMLTDMNNIDTTNDSVIYSVEVIQINQAKTRIKVLFNGAWVTANDISDSTLFTTVEFNNRTTEYFWSNKYYSFKWIDSSHILFYYVNIYMSTKLTFEFDHSAIIFNLDLNDSTSFNM